MAIKIAFSNHKGGVGKTTCTLNIGAALSDIGKKTLLVDLDPQANLSAGLGVMDEHVENSVYEALSSRVEDLPIMEISDKLDLVPSSINLSVIEMELAGAVSREHILSDLLKKVEDKYDYVLIDCQPSLGLLTLNALAAVDFVIIPLQPETFAKDGLSKLEGTIGLVQKRLNPRLKLLGIILNRVKKLVIHTQIAEVVADEYENMVFKNQINETVALTESQAFRENIFEYNDGKNKAAKEFKALTKEIISRLQETQNVVNA